MRNYMKFIISLSLFFILIISLGMVSASEMEDSHLNIIDDATSEAVLDESDQLYDDSLIADSLSDSDDNVIENMKSDESDNSNAAVSDSSVAAGCNGLDSAVSDSSVAAAIDDCDSSKSYELEDSTVEKPKSNKILGSSSTVTINGGSFEDIQTAIDGLNDGDTLVLNGTFKSTGKEVNVTKSLTIKGIGKTVLDGKNLSAIFYFCGENITLNGLTLINANEYFSAINGIYVNGNNYGNYSILNCNFEKNTGFYGSCIGLSGKVLYIKNSVFKNNYAERGGAIYLCTKNAYIQNSSFLNNEGILGGAIHNGYAKLSITNSTCKNNKADEGGVIYSECPITIANSYFTNNGPANGGVIRTTASLSITNSKFIKNNGIIETDAICTINKSHFENNTGNGNVVISSTSKVTIENSKFIKNQAKRSSIIQADGKITVKNCNFTQHISGIIVGPSYVEKCNFYKNTAVSISGNTYVVSSSFKNNKGGSEGGAIYSEGKSTVKKCIFVNNTAECGGAIFGGCTVLDSTFTKNIARSDSGGAIYYGRGNIIVKNSSFKNNYAKDSGGAIYCGSKKNSIINCTFINNRAKNVGGAINGNYLTLQKSTFKNNRAGGGGAIGGSDITVVKSKFEKNYASSLNGGAICADHLTVKSSTFTKNSAKKYGGAISSDFKATVIKSKFIRNSAKFYGSAICGRLECNLKVKTSTFSKNSLGKGKNPFAWPFRNYGKGIIVCVTPDSKFTQIKCKGIVKNTNKYKNSVKIKASKTSTVSKGKKYLTVKVVDTIFNLPVRFIKVKIKINGKKYTKAVDKKGKVKLLVKLAPRTYKTTITFKGNNNYFKSSKTVNFRVK